MTSSRSAARAAAELPPLVSTDWLAERLGAADLRVLDASAFPPGTGRTALEDFLAEHVPGAAFFDIEAASDPASPLPHTLPSDEAFSAYLAALGVRDDDTVVVYDGSGVNFSAPRAWWMLRAFGHRRVAVLDGGFGKWRRERRPVESGPAAPRAGRFAARLDRARVRDLDAVRENLDTAREQVVDARAAGRFTGEFPEPRPGLRGGHIPGSVNVPFAELVAADGTVLPPERLRARFHAAGVDLARPVVASCGSGVTACAVVLGLAVLGHDAVAVYDGSWSEWGGRGDVPVETG